MKPSKILFGFALVATALTRAPGRSVAAQPTGLDFEARAGAALSTPLLEATTVYLDDAGSVRAGDVTVRPSIAPYLGFTVVHEMEGGVSLDAAALLSRGGVEAEGPGGRWDAGSLTAIQATVGMRFRLHPLIEARGTVGIIVHRDSDLDWVELADGPTLLVSLGGQVDLPVPLPLAISLEAQGHPLGSSGLRSQGGVDGNVGRVLVGIVARTGGGR